MKTSSIRYKHILFTTEFFGNWKKIFKHAYYLSKKYNAKFSLLHVLNTELIDLLTFDVGLKRSSSIDKKFSEAKDFTFNVHQNLIKKITRAFGKDILKDINILVERGNPVKIILKTAAEKKCDLIVMGFKSKNVLDDRIIGSTLNKVLHKTKVPVLVIHNI